MNDESHDVLNPTLAAITVLFLAGVAVHFAVEHGVASNLLDGVLAVAGEQTSPRPRRMNGKY